MEISVRLRSTSHRRRQKLRWRRCAAGRRWKSVIRYGKEWEPSNTRGLWLTGLERQGDAVSNCGLVRRTSDRRGWVTAVQAFVLDVRPTDGRTGATVVADHCEISLRRISADNCTSSTSTTTTKATTTTSLLLYYHSRSGSLVLGHWHTF